jgi:hypothetical protein
MEHVIRAASHAAFPNCGHELLHRAQPFTREVLGPTYTDLVPRNFVRDKKIGAAGELLVSRVQFKTFDALLTTMTSRYLSF